eukprot:TRINITY_DN14962_c0_g1_i5.p3 TRINITY_DN14962_c0_g1~~TRINITY_DN14962_c0_g1_i5.p3  ORF type:complete len:470 (-),score=127.22 TRINITY_DN14962_c0_g1_i5:1669-3078(-)
MQSGEEGVIIPISENSYRGIIQGLIWAERTAEAHSLLELASNAGFSIHPSSFSVPVNSGLAKLSCNELMERFKNSLESNSFPDYFSLNLLMNKLALSNDDEKIQEIMDLVISHDAAPDIEIFHALIKCHLTRQDFPKVWKIIDEEIPALCSSNPTEETFKIVIQGLVGRNQREKAIEVVQMMKKKNLSVSEAICASIVQSFLISGQFETAKVTIERFEQEFGVALDPLKFFSLSLVQRLISNCQFRKAYELVMLIQSSFPEAKLESRTLERLAMRGAFSYTFEETVNLVKMVGHQEGLFQQILEVYLKYDQFEKAEKMAKFLITKSPDVSGAVISAVVRGYVSVGKLDRALEVAVEMSSIGEEKFDEGSNSRSTSVSYETYCTLASGFLTVGKLDEAWEVMQMMNQEGMPCRDPKLYGRLMFGHLAAKPGPDGKPANPGAEEKWRARQVYNEMKLQGVEPARINQVFQL